MNKKELYHFLPSLVFLIVLGILALLLFFGPDKDYSVNEKRYLAERLMAGGFCVETYQVPGLPDSRTGLHAALSRAHAAALPTRSPAGISSWA